MKKPTDHGKAETDMVQKRYGATTGASKGHTPPPKPKIKISPRKDGVKGTLTIKW